MSAQLESLTNGPAILLDKPILLIGRHPECDVLIESRKISRRHCCIAQVGDYLVVRDLGSTNGIRINGVRVLEGRLEDKDELTIGASRFRVRCKNGSAHPPDSASSKRKKRDTESPAPRNEDSYLERCDRPVPLAEPPGRRPSSPPRIVPDDLGLAPGSDMDASAASS
jgi:pSer/pThr/pTyr-binding forkhead associated (FHA) protein